MTPEQIATAEQLEAAWGELRDLARDGLQLRAALEEWRAENSRLHAEVKGLRDRIAELRGHPPDEAAPPVADNPLVKAAVEVLGAVPAPATADGTSQPWTPPTAPAPAPSRRPVCACGKPANIVFSVGGPKCSACAAKHRASLAGPGGHGRAPDAPDVGPESPEERFWAKVDKSAGPEGCWPWTGRRYPKGYGSVWFAGGERGTHVVACELAHGPPPFEGAQALHSCDNRPCCNTAHLRWGSHVENMRDMVERGRSATGDRNGSRTKPESLARGEENPQAKLSAEDVVAIRAAGGSVRSIAEQFGVSSSLIHQIKAGKIWRDGVSSDAEVDADPWRLSTEPDAPPGPDPTAPPPEAPAPPRQPAKRLDKFEPLRARCKELGLTNDVFKPLASAIQSGRLTMEAALDEAEGHGAHARYRAAILDTSATGALEQLRVKVAGDRRLSHEAGQELLTMLRNKIGYAPSARGPRPTGPADLERDATAAEGGGR